MKELRVPCCSCAVCGEPRGRELEAGRCDDARRARSYLAAGLARERGEMCDDESIACGAVRNEVGIRGELSETKGGDETSTRALRGTAHRSQAPGCLRIGDRSVGSATQRRCLIRYRCRQLVAWQDLHAQLSGAVSVTCPQCHWLPPLASMPWYPRLMRSFVVFLVFGALACGGATSQRNAGEFDRGGTQAALGSVDLTACRAAAGPSGRGHVKLTFAPDGSVTASSLDSAGPVTSTANFAGTPRGDCVLEKFRAVRVPAFDAGGPVSVGKTFTLE